jgi:hypothetical protein
MKVVDFIAGSFINISVTVKNKNGYIIIYKIGGADEKNISN